MDFHTDLIDFPNREPDMVTLYVYLDEVTKKESPLIILPESHFGGADIFPHNLVLKTTSSNEWIYKTDSRMRLELKHKFLTGGPGSTYFWHGCIMHGTLPNVGVKPRVSLRYILEKNPEQKGETFIDFVNSKIKVSPFCSG